MSDNYTDNSKNTAFKNKQLVKTVLFFDSALFLILALICLLKPELAEEFIGLDVETTTYLAYAFFAVSISTLIATRFILKERR